MKFFKQFKKNSIPLNFIFNLSINLAVTLNICFNFRKQTSNYQYIDWIEMVMLLFTYYSQTVVAHACHRMINKVQIERGKHTCSNRRFSYISYFFHSIHQKS